MADVTVTFTLDDQVSDRADKIAKSLRKIAGLEGGGGGGGDAKKAEESRLKRLASFAKTMMTLGQAANAAYKSFGQMYTVLEGLTQNKGFNKLFGRGTKQRAAFDWVKEQSRAKNEGMARFRRYNFLMEENGLTAAEAYNASGMTSAGKRGSALQARSATKALPAGKNLRSVSTSGPITVTGHGKTVEIGGKPVGKSLEKATETGVGKGMKTALPMVRAPSKGGLPGLPVSTVGRTKLAPPTRRGPDMSFAKAVGSGVLPTPSAPPKKGGPVGVAARAATSEVTTLGKKADGISPKLKKAGLLGGVGAAGVLGGIGLTLGIGAAVGAITGLVGIVGSAIGKIKDLGVALVTTFTKAAVSAGMFRENTLLGLNAMLKSDSAAKGVYNSAVKMAGKTPFATEQVVGAYKTLLGYGFKTKDLERTFSALGDMAAVKGDSSYIQRLGLVMGQIRGKGRLQGEELMQLAEAGLGQGDVFKALSKKLGKSEDEVRKMITAGEVKSDVAIDTILSVIENKFGGAMDGLSKSLGGLWSTITSRPFELFNAAFEGGGALSDAYEKIKEFAAFLSKTLDPTGYNGGRIVGIFQGFADVLGTVFNIGSTEDMNKALNSVLSTLETVMPYLKDFAGGFMKGLGKSLGPFVKGFMEISGSPEKLEALGKAAAWVGVAIGKLVGQVIYLTAATAAIGAAIAGAATAFGIGVSSVIGGITDAIVTAVKWVSKLVGKLLEVTGLISASPVGTLMSGAGAGGSSTYARAPSSPTVRNQDVPLAASAAAGSGQGGNRSFVVNVSGAGLTPDELMARARAEFSRMLDEALP